jgi:hypothetical protein
MQTPSGVLLNVHTKNGWTGLSGMFKALPTNVTFLSETKVKVTYQRWPAQEAEVNMPLKRKKRRYGRGDNRRRRWKHSYREGKF